MPKNAATHIQNIAPGPPMAMAVATPAMFPFPSTAQMEAIPAWDDVRFPAPSDLAKDFPMVRVDLFDINGKIILSELTFTPGGGLIPFDPIEADMILGKQLDISNLMS